jgi:hypothetical protein
MYRYPIILTDRFVNAGIVGFRGSTQPTGGNPTDLGILVHNAWCQPDIDTLIQTGLRPATPRSAPTETRLFQSLQKRLDNPSKNTAYTGLSKTQEQAEQLVQDILGSNNSNPVTRNGTNRNQQPYTDIFDPNTGRGVRILDNGDFDTFVNY